MAQQIDLLSPPAPEHTLSGFDRLESEGLSAWRWALGEVQRVAIPARAEPQFLSYRFRFPEAGSELVARSSNGELLRCRATRSGEVFAGHLELPARASAEPVQVEFQFARGPASPGDAPPNDARPLSYVAEAMTLLVQDPEPALSLPLPREIPATFCAVPFHQVFVNELGVAYPCCETTELIHFEKGGDFDKITLGAAGDLERAWNSRGMRRMRKEMLTGNRPKACSKCFAVEDRGSTSIRNLLNSLHQENAWKTAQSIDENGNVPLAPAMLDLRLGNLCNLRCQMCSPTSSVGLIPEYAEIHGWDGALYRHVDWFKKPGLMDEIAASCASLKTIHVAGGEPFLIPEFKQLLSALGRHEDAKNMEFVISTNFTLWKEDVLALFRHFRLVTFVVSLDGHGEVNDYIRYPSKFAQIDENLRKLHGRMQEFGVHEVRFNTTVQAKNVFHLSDLLRYLRAFPNFTWSPKLSVLSSPNYLSMLVLPPEARAEAKARLHAYLAEEEERWAREGVQPGIVTLERIRGEVEGIISYLDAEDRTSLIPEFRRVTGIFDAHRPNARKVPVPGIECALGN